MDFRLPDVGEGLTEAEVLTWYVGVGDRVEINQVIVEIETAKAMVELPCPFAGTVTAIHVGAGTTVPVGTPLVGIAVEQAGPDAGTDQDPSPSSAAPTEDGPTPILVGSGPKEAEQRRVRLNSRPRDQGASSGRRLTDNVVRTTPAVRRLAKDLGVDLELLGRETDGVVTQSDVEVTATAARHPAGQARETRIPIKGVRKATAAAMTRSAFTAPHVTEWLAVDVTATMEAVARLKNDPAWVGVRINPMVFVARAFVLAIRNFPDINATWDEDAQEIVVKDYVNLGIAVATGRGLIVPNVKDADVMDLRQLAMSLDALIATARSGRTAPADMSGGTVTLTNIGALGVDGGTPILNPGESAILAFGAVRPTPWVHDGELCVRQVTQLAMSFDHRLVDGELGSNVLARVGCFLRDPGATFLHV